MLLWQDVNDPDMVIIGDKAEWQSKESGKHERYVGWSSIHMDVVSDLFGGDAEEAVKRLKHQPAGTAVEVQLAVLRVDGDDVAGCETAKHQIDATIQGNRQDQLTHDLRSVSQWMEDLGI